MNVSLSGGGLKDLPKRQATIGHAPEKIANSGGGQREQLCFGSRREAHLVLQSGREWLVFPQPSCFGNPKKSSFFEEGANSQTKGLPTRGPDHFECGCFGVLFSVQLVWRSLKKRDLPCSIELAIPIYMLGNCQALAIKELILAILN